MHALVSALVGLLALWVASAQPIRGVVSDCASMASAFNSLQTRFDTASKPTPLSMTLTLNCTADWSGCSSGSRFSPNSSPSATQPKVTITINTNCKKGQSVTIPQSITSNFIVINTLVSNATCALSVVGPITINGRGIEHRAAPGTLSALKLKDVSFDGGATSEAYALNSVTITGGSFSDCSYPFYSNGIAKSVTITKATFSGYSSAAVLLEQPGNTRVTITGNTFRNAMDPIYNAIQIYQNSGGKMNINLGKTTTDNTSSVPICIRSLFPVSKPVIKVAGSVGITPIKPDKSLMPGGWPVSQDCDVAQFLRT